MTRSEAQYVAVDVKPPRKQSNKFNRVFNRDAERVRGLWERNGIYYAQIRVSGRKVRLRLEHATTVPQALEEMQALNCGFRLIRTAVPIITGHAFQCYSDSSRSETTFRV